MIPLPGAIMTPVPPVPGRQPVVAYVLVTVLIFSFLALHIAPVLGARGLVEPVVRSAGLIEATWTLYADPALFQPWQLWTWVLVGSSWGLWLGNCALTVVLAVAAERRIGSRWFLAALVILLPVAAGVHLLIGGVSPPFIQVGAGALVTGLAGLGWGLMRPVRLQLGLGWWAVLVVGWIPLFSLSLPVLGVIWSLVDGLAQGLRNNEAGTVLSGMLLGILRQGWPTVGADLTTLLVGSVLGVFMRRYLR